MGRLIEQKCHDRKSPKAKKGGLVKNDRRDIDPDRLLLGGNQMERWKEAKLKMGVECDADVAKTLIDWYLDGRSGEAVAGVRYQTQTLKPQQDRSQTPAQQTIQTTEPEIASVPEDSDRSQRKTDTELEEELQLDCESVDDGDVVHQSNVVFGKSRKQAISGAAGKERMADWNSKRKLYQCLRCLHRNNATYVEVKYRVEGHILKMHLGLDEVPYFCKLCLFRCFKKEDLDQHVTTFPRHRMMLKEKGLIDSPDMLVCNPSPHTINETDMVALSPAQANQHLLEKRKKKTDIVALALPRSCPDGIQTDLLTESPQTATLASPLAQQLELFQQFQEFKQLLGACAAATLPDSSITFHAPRGQARTETVTSGALLEEEEQTARPTAQPTEATTIEPTTTSPTLPTTATRSNINQASEVSPCQSVATFGTDAGVLVHDDLDYEDDVEEDVMADVLPGKTPSSVEVAETHTGQDEERGCQADQDGDVRQLLAELKRSTDRNTLAVQQQEEKVIQLASTMMELIRVLKEQKPKADKRTQTEEPPRKTQTEEPPRKTQTGEPSRKRPADDERRYSNRHYDGDKQRDDDRRYYSNNKHEEKRRREDRHDNRWRR